MSVVGAFEGAFAVTVYNGLFAPLQNCQNLDRSDFGVMVAVIGYSLPMFTWVASLTLSFITRDVGSYLFASTLLWAEIFGIFVGAVVPGLRAEVPACVEHGPAADRICTEAVIVSATFMHLIVYEFRGLRHRRRPSGRDYAAICLTAAYVVLGLLAPVYLGVFDYDDLLIGISIGLLASTGALAVFYHFITIPINEVEYLLAAAPAPKARRKTAPKARVTASSRAAAQVRARPSPPP